MDQFAVDDLHCSRQVEFGNTTLAAGVEADHDRRVLLGHTFGAVVGAPGRILGTYGLHAVAAGRTANPAAHHAKIIGKGSENCINRRKKTRTIKGNNTYHIFISMGHAHMIHRVSDVAHWILLRTVQCSLALFHSISLFIYAILPLPLVHSITSAVHVIILWRERGVPLE